MKFVPTKQDMATNFFSPSLLFLDPGSGMGKNQDPGSGINIPDPQHCEPLSSQSNHSGSQHKIYDRSIINSTNHYAGFKILFIILINFANLLIREKSR